MIAVSLWPIGQKLAVRCSSTARALVGVSAATAMSLLAGGLLAAAVTNLLFTAERSRQRVGWGWNRMTVATSAARWINEHAPSGRLWALRSSSNLLWLTGREVPVLTNTWAYPPAMMRRWNEYRFSVASFRSFNEMTREEGVETVVLHVEASQLARNITADPNWAVVDIAPHYVTWLRADGPNAGLASRTAITPETLDVEQLTARLAAADPVKHIGIYNGGLTLYHIGWYAPAAEVIGESLKIAPGYHRAWLMRGKCLALAGTRRMLHGDPSGREGLIEAKECFQHALALQGGDYREAADNLAYVDRQLKALESGKILYPRDELTPPGGPAR
jgi:hypothetical protein